MAVDFFETLSTMCTFFRSSPKRGCLLDKRVPQTALNKLKQHFLNNEDILCAYDANNDACTVCSQRDSTMDTALFKSFIDTIE